MQTIDAIYTGGKFEPLTAVTLAENERVRLTVQPSESEPDWLIELRKHQAYLKAKYGVFPDSTAIIREYRDRQ